MKNKTYIMVVALALTLVASPAFAQGVSKDKVDAEKKVDNFRKESREEIKDIRVEARKEIEVKKGDIKDTVQENRDEMEAKRQAFQTEMESLRKKIENAKTPEERDLLKKEYDLKFKQFKTEVKDVKAENHVEVKAKISDVKAIHVEAISKVYFAAIDRMGKIVDRAVSRSEKLTAEGKDMTQANASLVVAKDEVTAAKNDFAKLSTVSETDRKQLIVSIKTHLQNAHFAVSKAISVMKGNVAEKSEQNQ